MALRSNPPPNSEPLPGHSYLAWTVTALWILTGLVVASTEICDRDFGLHVALGRRLGEDFWAAGQETLGQSESLRSYAYSYWLYQVTLARLFDGLGAIGPWLLRIGCVSAIFAMALAAARQLGAGWRGLGLIIGPVLWIALERFVDRPDLLSHAFWLAMFFVLLKLRQDSRWVAPLVVLQLLWTNTHVYFPLGIAMTFAFALENFLFGARQKHWMVALLATAVASCLTPVGPLVWKAQVEMVALVFGSSAPGLEIAELQSPYAAQSGFAGLWLFRVFFPVFTALVLWRVRRLGFAVLATYALAAAIALIALRGMSFLAVTALAIVPATLPPRPRRAWMSPLLLLSGLCAVLTLSGLQNGRLYHALDKNLSIGYFGPPRFPTTGAVDWFAESGALGPLFHLPVAAGTLLLRMGPDFEPFLDARWAGTPDRTQTYTSLRNATDDTATEAWSEAVTEHSFAAAILDPYECPALLRALVRDPQWLLSYYDGGAAVFLRRDGSNDALAQSAAAAVAASWPTADRDRVTALSDLAVQIVSASPSPHWRSIHFDYESFYRGNFALQIEDGPLVREAYLQMLRNDEGGFSTSPNRRELLGNLLWALNGVEPKHGLAAVAQAIYNDDQFEAPTRWLAGLRLVDAWAAPGREVDLAPLLAELQENPLNGGEQLVWLSRHQAALFVRTGQNEDAVVALRTALAEAPSIELYQGLAVLLDRRLKRPEEALPFYEAYVRSGGGDPTLEARWRELSGSEEEPDR